MIPPFVVEGDEPANLLLQFRWRFPGEQVHLLLARAVVPLDLAVGLRMERRGEDMADPLGLQVVAEGLRDQRRPVVRQKLRAVFFENLVHPCDFARQFHDLAERVRIQRVLELLRQDPAAEIVQHRDQVIPAPVIDQQVRRIRLPHLVGPPRLDAVFRRRRELPRFLRIDPASLPEKPVHRGLRHRESAV